MTASWPADHPVPVRPVPRRPALGDHDFELASLCCRACGMPQIELWSAGALQRWCTGARDGDWERRRDEDQPRRAAEAAEHDRAFAAEAQAIEDARTFTWGQIRAAFGIPPDAPL